MTVLIATRSNQAKIVVSAGATGPAGPSGADISSFSASGNAFTLSTSSGANFIANIQPNSVRLSVDTTGPYLANLVAGTGVTLTNLGNEGTSPTIAIGQSVGINDDVLFANIVSNYNVTVNANLSFNTIDAGEY